MFKILASSLALFLVSHGVADSRFVSLTSGEATELRGARSCSALSKVTNFDSGEAGSISCGAVPGKGTWIPDPDRRVIGMRFSRNAEWDDQAERGLASANVTWTEEELSYLCDKSPEAGARIRKAIERGVDVDARLGSSGHTPLIRATMGCRFGTSPDVIRALIDAGADVNSQDDTGFTPLIGVFYNQRFDEPDQAKTISMLIDAGADLNLSSRNGMTTLGWAMAMNSNTEELVAMLLDRGADVAGGGHLEDSPLMTGIISCKVRKNEGSVQLLIDAGAGLNRMYERSDGCCGTTPLLYAALSSCGTGIIDLLIRNGADIHARNAEGSTLLMLLAQDSQRYEADYCRRFVEEGIDVDARDRFGRTALMYAARDRAEGGLFEILAEHGADVTATDEMGTTMLMFIAQNDSSKAAEILGQLITNGSDASDPDDAVDSSELMEEVLRDGIDINARDQRGMTALLYAAGVNKRSELIEFLIRHGADPLVEDPEGNSALQLFADGGTDPEVCQALIDAGIDVNARDAMGRTALAIAAEKGGSSVVEVLLENGADPRIRDNDDNSPLMLAAAGCRRNKIITMLVDAGSDVNQRGQFGWTPLIVAANKCDRFEVFSRLVDAGADPAIKDGQGMTVLDYLNKRRLSKRDRTAIMRVLENARK